jgi:hypothetical protein
MPGVNEKDDWSGLTWVVVDSQRAWEASIDPFSRRGRRYLGAFIVFIVAFLIGTRPGAPMPRAFRCSSSRRWRLCLCNLQPTGFQPVLLVIIAAQLVYPPACHRWHRHQPIVLGRQGRKARR